MILSLRKTLSTLLLISWLFPQHLAFKNVGSLLPVVKSHDACKSNRFQITPGICKFYFCKFLLCYEHERYTWRFLLSYIQLYLWLPIICCTICGKYISHIYKNIFDSSNDRLDKKILSQISKLQDKKRFFGFFIA